VSTSTAPKTFSPFWLLLLLAAINIGGPFLPVPNLVFRRCGRRALTLLYVGAVVGFALGVARKQFSIPLALADWQFAPLSGWA
jgi:hypothetical protein